MDKKLLNKFAENKCTSEEVETVLNWLQKQPDKLPEVSLFKSYWDNIELSESANDDIASKRLDKIHHIINLNHSEHTAADNRHILTPKNISIIQLFYRVAVILLMPVISLFIYFQYFHSEQFAEQKIEIFSPSGSRTFLELSDGTKVWLNHDSKLVYPQRFTGKTRTVSLVGEGYFEVAHNKSHPFVVESSGMTVKAVGTAFNVRAYNDGSDFETTLESGKVIIEENIPGKKETEFNIEPGQHFIFKSETNQYSIKTEELTKYVSWKEGKLIFKDDHLDKVAELLSRWFDVKIILSDPELRELTYTATFVNEPLSQILEMMEIVTPISYKSSERIKMPDGTYSKKEINIIKKERKKN